MEGWKFRLSGVENGWIIEYEKRMWVFTERDRVESFLRDLQDDLDTYKDTMGKVLWWSRWQQSQEAS